MTRDQTSDAARGSAPTAVVTSAHHWRAPIHLSAHHLAKALVDRGWKVAFVSTPFQPLHLLRMGTDGVLQDRFRSWRQRGEWDLDGRLFHFSPMALLAPSRLPGLRGAMLLRHWPRLTVPSLFGVLDKQGFANPDLAVIDSAVQAAITPRLGARQLVYRVTDRNTDFPGRPAVLDATERALASAADLVVYTGPSLEPYVQRLGARRSLCVPNGVDGRHFAAPRAEPAEYAAIPRPRAIYVGSIARWFDAALVAATARKLPHVSFVVIGPGAEGLGALDGLANVHRLGARPYADVPAYLQHADAGLIPFVRTELEAFVDDINPLKLYEYMAAGLPVVATRFRQLDLLQSPAALADGADAFAAQLAAALDKRRDGTGERAFAARHDWSALFAPLLNQLADVSGKR